MLLPNLPTRATKRLRVSIAVWLLLLLAGLAFLSCRPQPQRERAVAATPTPGQRVNQYPPGFGPAVLGRPYPGTGIIKIVNRKEGWVEIDHEAIKDLMPAMTMEFWVRDPSLMKDIRVGDKVDFVVVEDSKGEFLTELNRVVPSR